MPSSRTAIPDDAIPLPDGAVGLLSDPHGDADVTARAADALIDAGVASLLLLGDLCGEAVLESLAERVHAAGRAIPVRIVFGNMDEGLEGRLRRAADRYDFGVDHPVGRYIAGGRTIIAHHGHHRGVEEAALASAADYYVHGHTHRERDERIGDMRVINPGALHRAARYSVTALDPLSDALKSLEISKGA